MTEALLIELLISGSEKAFDEIYKIHSTRLFSFCHRFIKSRETAEEIVQDVFIKLWTNKESIQNKESLSSLLFTIARNRLINSYRSTLNSPIYVEYCDIKELSHDEASQPMEYDDFCAQIKIAMKKLSHAQSRIWEYSKMQGLSNKEIAALLKISEKTVRNQLSLSLHIMRTELKIPFWYLILCILYNNHELSPDLLGLLSI